MDFLMIVFLKLIMIYTLKKRDLILIVFHQINEILKIVRVVFHS